MFVTEHNPDIPDGYIMNRGGLEPVSHHPCTSCPPHLPWIPAEPCHNFLLTECAWQRHSDAETGVPSLPLSFPVFQLKVKPSMAGRQGLVCCGPVDQRWPAVGHICRGSHLPWVTPGLWLLPGCNGQRQCGSFSQKDTVSVSFQKEFTNPSPRRWWSPARRTLEPRPIM